MRVTLFVGGVLGLFAICACAPGQDVIEKIPPKQEPIPSSTGNDGSKSGAADEDVASNSKATITAPARQRRSIGGLESDLIPGAGDVDASAFGEQSQFEGHGRIKVLPAFLG